MSAGRLALLREEVSKAEFANELDGIGWKIGGIHRPRSVAMRLQDIF